MNGRCAPYHWHSNPFSSMRPMAIMLFLFCLVGCRTQPSPAPVIVDLTIQEALARQKKDCAQRLRIEGMIRAKVSGIQGLWANAKMDLVAEKPKNVHLAIRSFFEQPIQVISTDGQTLAIYDASGQSGPQFFQGPLHENTMALFSPIPISPQELVQMLLGCAPSMNHGSSMTIDPKTETYTLQDEIKATVTRVTARLSDDTVLKSAILDSDHHPILEITYAAHRAIGGMTYPHEWVIRSHSQNGTQSFTLKGQDLLFNGPPSDPVLFQMTAPPGMEVRPLSDLHPHPL